MREIPKFEPGFVYFASCEMDDFPIKIGFARDTSRRLRELQVALPYKVVLLHSFAGTMEDERTKKLGFREYRLRGEWFSRGPSLLKFLDRADELCSHMNWITGLRAKHSPIHVWDF